MGRNWVRRSRDKRTVPCFLNQITRNDVVGYDQVGNAVGAAVTIYVIYQVGKWALATLLAPTTGGVSLGVAAATP